MSEAFEDPAARPEMPGRQTILLIGGMPRSGTTLLSNLIQQHLHIPVVPETHFFDIALPRGVNALPEEVRADPQIMAGYDGLDLKGDSAVPGFRTLVERLAPGPGTIGEKTPDHLMHFRRILQADPAVKAIAIVRACEKVCDSLAGMPWNERGFRWNLELWVKFYLEAVRLRRDYPGRIAVIEYEQLCKMPEAVLSEAAAGIGLEPNAEPLPSWSNYDEDREPWKRGARDAVRPAAGWTPSSLAAGPVLLATLVDRLLRLAMPLRK